MESCISAIPQPTNQPSIKPEIRLTDDGSSTLYLSDIDESYHSTKGALTESRHVYIDNALKYRASAPSCHVRTSCFKVFEVGFGTGLNATLAAMTDIPLIYTAIEKFPLSSDIVEALDYGDGVDSGLYREIADAPFGVLTDITPTFALQKIEGDFTTFEPEEHYDVIFMDAFAPEKQPEMWSDDMLRKLAEMLAPGGVMTTYCAKGAVRRAFERYGLRAERIPGPPGGKREMLRLIKPDTYTLQKH